MKRYQVSITVLVGVVLYAAAWLWIISDPFPRASNLITPAVLVVYVYGIVQAFGNVGPTSAYWSAFVAGGAFGFYLIDEHLLSYLVDNLLWHVDLWAFPAWMPVRLLIALAVSIPTASITRTVYDRTRAGPKSY